MQILILTWQLFHWKDVIIQLWQLSKISRNHVREPCLSCIIQNSVCPRLKFGNLCFAFGTKTNIRGAKMAYNRPAVNINVLQIYLTSDVLSLYSSQPACEKIHPNQYGERLAKIRRPHKRSQCEDGCHSQTPLFWNDNGYQIEIYQQEQLGTVWNQQDWSQRL